MKKTLLSLFLALSCLYCFAQIDMQAHAGSDEGLAAYSSADMQAAYYTGSYTYDNLIVQEGNDLFGSLNALRL